MKKKWLRVTLAAAAATISMSAVAYGAGWQQDGKGWWWQNENGTWPANTWVWLDGNQDGIAECYYFNGEGYMLSNANTPDNYTVDASGAWISNGVVQTRRHEENTNQEQGTGAKQAPASGWNQEENGVWRYYVNSKAVADNWRKINGKQYYFDSTGIMLTGFHDIDGNSYYFTSDGALKKKSFNLNGVHYEVDENGAILDEQDEEEWKYQNRTASNGSQNTGASGSTGSTSSGSSQSAEVDMSGYASRVFELVNQERQAAGKSALEWDDTVGMCADARAKELPQKYSHTRPDGTRCFTIYKEYGVSYSSAGENIAQGFKTPEQVMNGWMNSSGHKANILNSNFGKIGVGFYYDGQYHWVQMFTN